MKIEKLYKKIGKKFSKYYNRSYYFDAEIVKFTFDPYYALRNKSGQEIIVKLITNKEDLKMFIKELEKKLKFIE